MNIGKVIQVFRTKQNLSQEELAKKVEITQTSLSQIETGKKLPSERTLQKLADAFKTSVAYIKFAALEPDDIPVDQREDFMTLIGNKFESFRR